MSDMARVRMLLQQAMDRTANEEVISLIEEAISYSYRDYVKKKAPCESQKITRHIANMILDDYRKNSNQSCMTLASRYKVNAGRISELLSGKHEYSEV